MYPGDRGTDARGTDARGTAQRRAASDEPSRPFELPAATEYVSTAGLTDPDQVAALEAAFASLPLMLLPPRLLLDAAQEKSQQLNEGSAHLGRIGCRALSRSLLAIRERIEELIDVAPTGPDGLPALEGVAWPAGTTRSGAKVDILPPFPDAPLWRAYLARTVRERPAHEPLRPKVSRPQADAAMGVHISGPVLERAAVTTQVRRAAEAFRFPAVPRTVAGAVAALAQVTVGQAVAVHGHSPTSLPNDVSARTLRQATAAVLYAGPGFAAAFEPNHGLTLDTPIGVIFGLAALTDHKPGIYWIAANAQATVEISTGRIVAHRNVDMEIDGRVDEEHKLRAWIKNQYLAGIGFGMIFAPSYWRRRSFAAAAADTVTIHFRGRLHDVAQQSIRYLPAEAGASLDRLRNLTAGDVLIMLLEAAAGMVPVLGWVLEGIDAAQLVEPLGRAAGMANWGNGSVREDIDAAARVVARVLVGAIAGKLVGHAGRAVGKAATRRVGRVRAAPGKAASTGHAKSTATAGKGTGKATTATAGKGTGKATTATAGKATGAGVVATAGTGAATPAGSTTGAGPTAHGLGGPAADPKVRHLMERLEKLTHDHDTLSKVHDLLHNPVRADNSWEVTRSDSAEVTVLRIFNDLDRVASLSLPRWRTDARTVDIAAVLQAPLRPGDGLMLNIEVVAVTGATRLPDAQGRKRIIRRIPARGVDPATIDARARQEQVVASRKEFDPEDVFKAFLRKLKRRQGPADDPKMIAVVVPYGPPPGKSLWTPHRQQQLMQALADYPNVIGLLVITNGRPTAVTPGPAHALLAQD